MLRFPRGRAVRVFLVSLFVFITGQCLLGAIVSSKWKEMAQLVTEDRLSMGSGIRWLWMVAFWWWHLKTSYFDWFGFGEKFSGVGCLFLFLLPDAIVSVISQTSTEMGWREGISWWGLSVILGIPTVLEVKQIKKPRPYTCSNMWNNTYCLAVTNQGLYPSVCRLCSIRWYCVCLNSSSEAHFGPQEVLSLLDSFVSQSWCWARSMMELPTYSIHFVRNGLEKVIPLSSG